MRVVEFLSSCTQIIADWIADHPETHEGLISKLIEIINTTTDADPIHLLKDHILDKVLKIPDLNLPEPINDLLNEALADVYWFEIYDFVYDSANLLGRL
jgi:hypothetical protein